MCCPRSCYSVIFGVTILIELVCGLVGTTTAAFSGYGVVPWGYLLFAVYAGFVVFIIGYLARELKNYEEASSSLNWICGLSTVITLATFLGIITLVKPKRNKEVVIGCAVIIAILLFFLGCVVQCYNVLLNMGLVKTPKPRERPRVQYHVEEGKEGEEASMEQSLAKMVNHVQNNPTQKTYQMYAMGSGTPFQVSM